MIEKTQNQRELVERIYAERNKIEVELYYAPRKEELDELLRFALNQRLFRRFADLIEPNQAKVDFEGYLSGRGFNIESSYGPRIKLGYSERFTDVAEESKYWGRKILGPLVKISSDNIVLSLHKTGEARRYVSNPKKDSLKVAHEGGIKRIACELFKPIQDREVAMLKRYFLD